MYITTSRKPSNSTKILASNISIFLNSTYEPRGKKSIEEITDRAKALGFTRIMVLSETKGNPNKLAFIDAQKEWRWLFPFLIISAPTEYTTKRIKPVKKEVEMTSDKGSERIAELFDIPFPRTDDVSRVRVSKSRIEFRYRDSKLALNVKDLLESRLEEEQ